MVYKVGASYPTVVHKLVGIPAAQTQLVLDASTPFPEFEHPGSYPLMMMSFICSCRNKMSFICSCRNSHPDSVGRLQERRRAISVGD
jgi:hypothetical protein